ncbi:hypothetical protein GCM10028806_13070 [Spirosoma terrae]|uniref:Uncharacterized protein n=1 Tax=Spirosoma terrae TaxID=1968276 RepID=A0A6L9L743_9BACT|nr:hypothetical protein [Spirosoma terrae]NDU94961.1 hypothetical protein [Spirosoma terrae]
MDDKDMINLWKSYDKRLEESLILNRKNTEEITRINVQNSIGSMKPVKLVILLVGIAWVSAGSVLVVNLLRFSFEEVSKFFLFSATAQLFITLLAIIVYLYQFVLIQQVDSSEPILETQKKVAQLQSSTLWVTRILFLQLPLWTTFYLSESLFKNANLAFYLLQGFVTLSFTYAAFWLFVNINYGNSDKKWFRLLFDGREWTPVIKSMEMLRQIEEYH